MVTGGQQKVGRSQRGGESKIVRIFWIEFCKFFRVEFWLGISGRCGIWRIWRITAEIWRICQICPVEVKIKLNCNFWG